MWRFFSFIIVAFLMQSIHGLCQSTSECAELESHGIYNTVDMKTSASQFQQAQAFFQSHTFHSRDEAFSEGAKLGIPLGDLLNLSFGGQRSSQNFEAWESAFLEASASAAGSSETTSVAIRTVSESLISAVKSCIGMLGVHAYLEGLPDGQSFIVNARYLSDGPPYEIEGTVVITPKAVRDTCTLASTTIDLKPGGTSFSCKRSAQDTVIIIINSTHGSRSLYLAGHKPPQCTFDLKVSPMHVELPGALVEWRSQNCYSVTVYRVRKDLDRGVSDLNFDDGVAILIGKSPSGSIYETGLPEGHWVYRIVAKAGANVGFEKQESAELTVSRQ